MTLLAGTEVILEARGTDRVTSVQAQVASELGVPPCRLRLYAHDGVELTAHSKTIEKSRTLQQYGIIDDVQLYAVLQEANDLLEMPLHNFRELVGARLLGGWGDKQITPRVDAFDKTFRSRYMPELEKWDRRTDFQFQVASRIEFLKADVGRETTIYHVEQTIEDLKTRMREASKLQSLARAEAIRTVNEDVANLEFQIRTWNKHLPFLYEKECMYVL